MKHIFVINPAAGPESSYERIKASVAAIGLKDPYEIYETKAPVDATVYIRNYCSEHPDEKIRFYACGGDGTLNEVANGIVGFANASMTCYPCGSGNDFVKYYGGKKVFTDLKKLVVAEEYPIDLMRVGNRYSINATHFGFDSSVAKTMTNVRRKKIIGGKNAYTTGVVVGLLTAMKNKCKVYADGVLLNPNGHILLCTVANGQYVGGSFRCAPRSRDDDGLLEVCIAKPISHVKFLSLMKDYTKGTHLDNPKCASFMIYCRAKSVRVEAPKGFVYSADGELIEQNEFTVEVAPGAVKFAVPEGFSKVPGELLNPPTTK